jgi:VanZ family protein
MRDEKRRPAFFSSLFSRLSRVVFRPATTLSRYAPVVVWVAFIFFASTGNLSASNTSRIIRPLVLWLFPDITEPALLQVHFYVRKAAHFFEYAVLALLASRAFLTSPRPRLRRNWHAAAFALVAACALLDEYNQSFNAARTGTIYDSLLDMTGGATALGLLALLRRIERKRAVRP